MPDDVRIKSSLHAMLHAADVPAVPLSEILRRMIEPTIVAPPKSRRSRSLPPSSSPL
jgi:hypothetical protein